MNTFYVDFTSRLLKQIWLFPYPYGFCNTVQIHGMKINDMIHVNYLRDLCCSWFSNSTQNTNLWQANHKGAQLLAPIRSCLLFPTLPSDKELHFLFTFFHMNNYIKSVFQSIARSMLSNIKYSWITAFLHLHTHRKYFDEDVNVYYVMLYELLQSPICTVGGFSMFHYLLISSFSCNNFSDGYRLFSSITTYTRWGSAQWRYFMHRFPKNNFKV